MKKNVFAVILPILLFLFICGQGVCKASLPASVEFGYKSLTATATGTVLFWGWDEGYGVNYDSSNLTDQEKEDFIKIGLQALSDEFNKCEFCEEAIYCSMALSRFYHEKNDVKKHLYWALKGAENGSSTCMCLLSSAYCHGKGVLLDLTESVKWTYLAAAAGDEYSKQWVKGDGRKLMSHEQTASMMKEAQKRAKAWAEAHKDAFFSPV